MSSLTRSASKTESRVWQKNLSSGELPHVRVAVLDGVVMGFCAVATPSNDVHTGDEFAEITALNVNPDAWRSGVGTALMADAFDRFRRDGWQLVSLWVVDGNDRAQNFYRRSGFEFDGTSKRDEPDGATIVRMRSSLAGGPTRI